MIPSHCIEPTYQQAKVTHSRQNSPAADQINNARSKKRLYQDQVYSGPTQQNLDSSMNTSNWWLLKYMQQIFLVKVKEKKIPGLSDKK